MTLSVEHMETLPDFFRDIDDPRRKEGRRHALPSVLALATAAVLCGMRGYKAIKEWVDDLKPSELRRFRNGRHERPSEWLIRDILVRVDPEQLDAALRAWQEAHGGGRDTALAIDGKTMRGGRRRPPDPYPRHRRPRGRRWVKKTVLNPGDGSEGKRTNEIGVVVPLVEALHRRTGLHRRRHAGAEKARPPPPRPEGALPVHGQGQPEDAAPGHPAPVRRDDGRARARLRAGAREAGARTPRAPLDLGVVGNQRIRGVPRRRSSPCAARSLRSGPARGAPRPPTGSRAWVPRPPRRSACLS